MAHARVEFPLEAYEAFRANGGKTLPIYLRIVDGIAYVGENYSGNPDIHVGDELVTLNGEPMSDWLHRASAYIAADSDYIAHSLLEFTFPREFWALNGELDRFTLGIKRGDESNTVVVEASNRKAQQDVAGESPDSFALDDGRSYRMLDDSLAYLRPGPFYSFETPEDPWDNAAFVAFIDGAFEHFLAHRAEALVIDLRQNPGGDNSFSDAMLAWIADEPFRFFSKFLVRSSDEAAASNASRLSADDDDESVTAKFAEFYATVPRGEVFSFELPYAMPRTDPRFDGEVYVLINRHSYSNAANVAAIVQDYELGIIVGEETSDFATTYGAMEQFQLPGSGIGVGFPKAHIIRPNGDTNPGGVIPDWEIISPVKHQTEDVVLERLIAMIKAGAES